MYTYLNHFIGDHSKEAPATTRKGGGFSVTNRTQAECGQMPDSFAKGLAKQKNIIIQQNEFSISNNVIPALRRTYCWRYLSAEFSPKGRSMFIPSNIFTPLQTRLMKAPLKPQQSLHVLRCFLLPRLYHRVTPGSVTIEHLNRADMIIRHYLRTWLNLPHNSPIAYFYIATSDGDLVIFCLH